MPSSLATIFHEADDSNGGALTWNGDEITLSLSKLRHKHSVAVSFQSAGDWVELLYVTGNGTPVDALQGSRHTATAADASQGAVLVFQWEQLANGYKLRRSGSNVELVAHECYDDRRVGGSPS